MQTKSFLAATALLSTAHAWGSFAIINRCPFDVYLWSVAGGEPAGKMVTLPGGKPEIGYRETYRETVNRGGVSVKASPNYGPGFTVPMSRVTQLEYTVPDQTDPRQTSVKNLIFYDLSWVDGNVFEGIALTMETSMGNTNTPCPSGTCGIGQSCDIGYQWSTDDTKTHACSLEQDVIWTFCSTPGGKLQSKMGLLGKRESEADAAPAADADADADADALAVCVSLDDPNGRSILCPEDQPAPVPPPKPTTTKQAPPPVTSSPVPVVALQQGNKAVTTSSTTTAASAVPTAPVPIGNPGGGPVPIQALTNIQAAGVSTWLTYDGSHFTKRDLSEHSAHRHNHQQFHRRNRIIKSSAQA